MATIEIRGQLRPRGFPVAVGPQDGGRYFAWEQATLCVYGSLGLGQGTQALTHRVGAGRQLPPSSASSEQTQSVWSARTGLSPRSLTVLVFWCPGQPRQNRVSPSAAFWFPECSCHLQDQTLSPGPLPSQGTGGLLWILDPSHGRPRESSPLTWPGTVGGTPLRTTSHVVPTLLVATSNGPGVPLPGTPGCSHQPVISHHHWTQAPPPTPASAPHGPSHEVLA